MAYDKTWNSLQFMRRIGIRTRQVLSEFGAFSVSIQLSSTELLSNVVYSKLTLGGFPAVDCAFINTVDELHAGNHISELPEST